MIQGMRERGRIEAERLEKEFERLLLEAIGTPVISTTVGTNDTLTVTGIGIAAATTVGEDGYARSKALVEAGAEQAAGGIVGEHAFGAQEAAEAADRGQRPGHRAVGVVAAELAQMVANRVGVERAVTDPGGEALQVPLVCGDRVAR